ncbi:MAG: ATP-binding protein [Proteobacteria bacterium]|nr:ATP-binding protein [Pseudomonadota bacterium]
MGESSFLKRASRPINLLGNAKVEITWGHGSTGQSPDQLLDAVNAEGFEGETEDVCYLSQHFVDRLCSSAGLATELRREMERVVFEATDPTDRLEADSFDVLKSFSLEPIQKRREELQSSIHTIAERLVIEEVQRERLPSMKKEAERVRFQINKSQKEMESLLPKGKEARAQRLVEVDRACTKTETKIEAFRRHCKLLKDLADDVEQTRTTRETARHAETQRRFDTAHLTPDDWFAFRMKFEGDVDGILNKKLKAVERYITLASEGDPSVPLDTSKTPLKDWPLKYLRNARDKMKKEVGIDTRQKMKYEGLQKFIGKQEASLRRLETEIAKASGANERRNDLIVSRRDKYAEIFQTFVEEEDFLRQLYLPLAQSLAGSVGALAKLAFVIKREVDIDAWVKNGEELLDLRRYSQFRGHGELRKAAGQYLLKAWTQGTAEGVATAMDNFRKKFQTELLKAKPASVAADETRFWTQSLADWLYNTSHIQMQYDIQYDGVAIEQLSPGTRGIVLLLLYLAVDQHDRRPLIIDQPEENLDPKSVFEELVPHFRAVRHRRQVIVVTHNANLVVNTDADQVIIADSRQTEDGGLPTISYWSGSIENPEIRTLICQLLEGGERAFLEREKRYRLRWGETYPPPSKRARETPQLADEAKVFARPQRTSSR